VHLFEAITRLLRVQRSLVQQLGREPTHEELALEAGFLSDEDTQTVTRARAENQMLDPEVQRRWVWATAKVQRILHLRRIRLVEHRWEMKRAASWGISSKTMKPWNRWMPLRVNCCENRCDAFGALSERERQVMGVRFA
jgi:RNA polymerase primary sigma factor